MSDYAKEHYHFELSRRSEINAHLKSNIQLSLGGIGFLYLLGKGAVNPDPIFIVSYWVSFIIFTLSIGFTAFATLYYSTRFPDTPKTIEEYHKALIEHDPKTADLQLQAFLSKRWIENASENAKRNRGRSRLNLVSRILIVTASFPLLLVAILSVKVPFLP